MNAPTSPRHTISPETTKWSANLDTVLPITGSDLPDFNAWVNCNGFLLEPDLDNGQEEHLGFDFGAYLRTDGVIIVGLPKSTPVRAVANGVVKEVCAKKVWGGYACSISLEHGAENSGMVSGYTHVDPAIEEGARVSKGEVLGTLFKDPGNGDGRLVHLHFSIADGHRRSDAMRELRILDPGLIDGSIYDHTVEPQGFQSFEPQQVAGATALELANFSFVRVNDSILRS